MSFPNSVPIIRRYAGLLALAVILAGCVQGGRGGNPDAADPAVCPIAIDETVSTTARIAWQGIPNGDLVVKDRNWLEACMPNASINWVRMNSGADVVQAFGADSIDVAQVGSSPAVKAVSAPLNLDLQLVWLSGIIGTAESLVTWDPAVTYLLDLAERTVAVPFGSTAHFSLQIALGQAGISEQVELINLAPDAMLAAWQKHQVDAAWVWEPTLSKLLEDGRVIYSSAETAAAGTPTFDGVLATRSFTAGNVEFMHVWTALQALATQELRDDPDIAAESIGLQLGISPADAQLQLKGYSYPSATEILNYFRGDLPRTLQVTAQFLKDQAAIEMVENEPFFANILYTDALDSLP